MGGTRIAVQIDAVAQEGFDHDDGRSLEDKALGFLRIVSTQKKIWQLMNAESLLTVGDWVQLEVTPKHDADGPWVWSLQLRDNRLIGDEATKRPAKGKLVSIKRLSSGSPLIDPQPLGASVPIAHAKGSALKKRFSLSNVAPTITPAAINTYLRKWSRVWGVSCAEALDVGQASFNVISPTFRKGPLLYFDVGQPIWFHIHNAPPNFSPPCTRSGLVILSHWDTDHYAFGRQNPVFHEKTWIAPAQSSVGPNANYFANLLQNKSRLYLVGQGKSSRHRRGARVIRCNGTSINGSGLALHLRKCGRDILFTGDADYHEIPSVSRIQFSSLQIPHHGGKIAIPSITPRGGTNPSKAVISCGFPNRYGHPHSSSIIKHLNSDWKIEVTAGWRGVSRGNCKY
ncbi:MAG: hypothetical protein ABJN98_06740 [Roseibium sp.]